MKDKNGQPFHHSTVSWRSSFQNYIVGNFLGACHHHGEYDKMYRRWKKSVASGKHFLRTMHDIEREQRLLDCELADLEARDHEYCNWQFGLADAREEPMVDEAFARLTWLQKLRCRYYAWKGHSLKSQLYEVVEGFTLPDQWSLVSTEEINAHFGIDYDAFLARKHAIGDELRDLFWDAVFLPDLIAETQREQQQRERQQQVIKARKKREALLEKVARATASLEEFLTEYSHKYDRMRFQVRSKDYKRGNPLDNYFRSHLMEIVLRAFGSRCCICHQADNLHLDHWAIPKNEGGNFVLYDSDAANYS